MPVFTPTVATGPVQQLSRAVVEGEGAVTNLIGKLILPEFPLNNRSAHLPKLTLANTLGLRLLTDNRFLRAPGTKYERMVAQINDTTIATNLIGAELVIPNEVEMEWDEYMDVVGFFTARAGQEWSALTKEFFTSQAVFNVANTVSGSAANSSVAYTPATRDILGALGMNPIQDIISGVLYGKTLGERYDYVAMSFPVWLLVSTCQNTLQFVRGIFGAITEVNQDNFTKALAAYGIKDVFIGDSYFNSAADGATPALTQLWSNTYMSIGRRGMASQASESTGVGVPTIGGLGVNAFWTGFKPGGKVATAADEAGGDVLEMEGGNYIETYPDLSINSLVVRVGISSKPFIGNNRCNYLVGTNYSAT